MRQITPFSSLILAVAALTAAPIGAAELTPGQRLGKGLFFDHDLSLQRNQACVSCHLPAAGFTGPQSDINAAGAVHPGSVPDRFGNRKPPSVAYASPSPVLHLAVEDGESLFIGGAFHDGRATGEKLGSPVADQAQGPFLNPVEQALPQAACVVQRVCRKQYGSEPPMSLGSVWPGACDIDWPDDLESACGSGSPIALPDSVQWAVERAYGYVALALAAYESSPEVNAYSSKYDAYLAGEARLSAEESRGLELYEAEDKGNCAACHPLAPRDDGGPPLFTDFSYDNLGVPRNPENPWYTQRSFNAAGQGWDDLGLGGFLADHPAHRSLAQANDGKHKVPTLRNVDKRPTSDFIKAYMHNGYFKDLWQVVHFYNTRDVKPRCESLDPPVLDATVDVALANGCWPAPEVADNVNTDELGDLGLSEAEELALVAFMMTMSDGYLQ